MATCALLVAIAPATARPAVATARAKATTVRPVSLVRTADLSFGDILASAAAGSVTVNSVSDAATYVGVQGAGGTVSAARFLGAGTAGQIVTVRWSTAPFVLTRVGGGATMQVDTLRTNCVLFCFAGSDPRIVPADRVLDIRFGGRLLVGANQREGEYQGQFAVTVDYP